MVWIRPGMTSRIVVQDTFNLDGTIDFLSTLKDIILFTFVIEGIGAALPYMPKALKRAILPLFPFIKTDEVGL